MKLVDFLLGRSTTEHPYKRAIFKLGFKKRIKEYFKHDLIIAKLEAYSLEIGALRLTHDYLINRKQRVKVNEAYSSEKDIIFGVPQGSILGPLLFNTHLCNLFYFLEDFEIASYADDTTIYTTEKNEESLIAALEKSSAILFKWFKNNYVNKAGQKLNALALIAPFVDTFKKGLQ